MSRGRGSARMRGRTQTSEEDDERTQGNSASRCSSPILEEEVDGAQNASLLSILNELKDFRRDNKQHFTEIKQELRRTNNRLEEAEGRIDEVETTLVAATTLLKRLCQRHASMEAKLIDQEGRARRDNIRIYGIPEGDEGDNMTGFVQNLLKVSLDLSPEVNISVERAHRALTAKPTSQEAKPRSIIVKFASYKVKEEVVRKAWQKKELFHNTTRFYVDHDYPAAILKRRMEYAEAKKVLKGKQIKFHTPYPAKLRVFYKDGTCLYQNAAEATEDMTRRGFPVTIIPAQPSPDSRELQLLSSWKMVQGRHTGASNTSSSKQQDG